MKFLRSTLDWLGWERLSETNKRHEQLLTNQKIIIAKLSTLSSQLTPIVEALRGLPAQLEKAKTEIITALGDVEIPAEATAKIESLGTLATAIQTAVQGIDDLNADAPAPEAQG